VNDATAARATTRPAVFAATEHGSRTVPVLGLGALVAVAAHLRRAASTSLAAKAASPPSRLRGTGTSLRFAASAWLCKRCGACSSCREQATHDGSGSARRRQAPCCSGTISGVSYGSDHASGLSPLGNPPRGGCSQRRTAAGACAAVAMRTSGRGPVSKRKASVSWTAGQLDSLAGLAGLERRSRRRGEGAPS